MQSNYSSAAIWKKRGSTRVYALLFILLLLVCGGGVAIKLGLIDTGGVLDSLPIDMPTLGSNDESTQEADDPKETRSSASSSSGGTAGYKPTGSALPVPAEAPTGEEIMKQTLIPWLQSNWAISETDLSQTGISQAKWDFFVKAAIKREVDWADAPDREKMQSMAEDLRSSAAKHPVAAYLVGRNLADDDPAQEELLEKAYNGFSRRAGSEILAYHAAVEWALAPGSEEANSQVSIEEWMSVLPVAMTAMLNGQVYLATLNPDDPVASCIAAMRRALQANQGFANFHDRLAGYLLLEGAREGFVDSVHEEIHKEISQMPAVKPWLKKWVEGIHYHKLGWEVRGGGYSNTVSSENMAIFRRNMTKARRVVAEAWELGPKHPAVAADLIAMSLNQGDTVSKLDMRKWIEEMVKVQVDYDEGFSGVLWGLRPRWHGSTEEMLKFGKQCLNTNRFDSSTPLWFLQAHKDVASEWDLPDKYFPELRNTRDLEYLFKGLEAEPKRKTWRHHDRSQALITFFKCGKYDLARSWLDKLDGEKLDARALRSWGISDDNWIIGKTEAFTGDHGEQLQKAERYEKGFQAGSALKIYEKVLAKPGSLSDMAKAYVGYRQAVAAYEDKWDTDRRLEGFVPKSLFDGWISHGGQMKTGDGTVTFSGENGPFYSSTCDARLGSSFQLEGKISVKSAGKGIRAFISFGYPEENNDRWSAVSFVFEEESAAVLLSNTFNRPEETTEIPFKSSYEYQLDVAPSGITLTVDGEVLWNDVPVPRKFVKERYAQVGFGCLLGEPDCAVTLSDTILSKK